ncbi:MAG: hypothetical protein RL264_194 [Bacteroidota bacterium]|jgi:hypothetical protein
MIEELIDLVVNDPTENNKNQFEVQLNSLEYSLLVEAENFPKKSQEYFDCRRKAFSVRPEYAKIMLNKWVSKYKSTNGCPVNYEMTLNIPFRQIKKP